MSETSTLIGYGGRTIGREELTLVPIPAATETHRPVRTTKLCKPSSRPSGFATSGSFTMNTPCPKAGSLDRQSTVRTRPNAHQDEAAGLVQTTPATSLGRRCR
jgi:hypothetical protein